MVSLEAGPGTTSIGVYDHDVAANPAAVPSDTSPDAWKRHMAGIAGRSIPDRLDDWAQLNRGIALMAEQAVRRRHPDYDDRQVFLALVRRLYGDDLALEVWPEAATVDR